MVSILIISFPISQIGFDIETDKISKPIQGEEFYGTYSNLDIEIIKPNAVKSLIFEYMYNDYTSYPYGFYKMVHLSEEKDRQMGQVISALTGESFQTIDKLKTNNALSDEEIENIGIKSDLSNEEFKELMEIADITIGKGSYYGKVFLEGTFGYAERDYDVALEEYNLIIEEDRISGAYARYFSDYLKTYAP